MLVDETTQTCLDLYRKAFQQRTVNEGIQLWKAQQDQERRRKLKEQKELREMLEKYWPFGQANEMKPRGLRNLRRDGLFPNKDYENAKRFVGTLDLGRPGGGAPLVTDTGKRMTRTRIDPILRYQFGSKDLRRCVDNTIRYKTNKEEQEEYRKQLDKLVEEKKLKEAKNKLAEQEFDRKHGWSNSKTFKQYENEQAKYRDQLKNKLKNIKVIPPNKIKKIDPIFYPCRNVCANSKNKKLSPLPNGKDYGVELVPILAKQRNYPIKIHLDSTDITNEKKLNFPLKYNRYGSGYLRELNQQMSYKQQKLKEMKAKENETISRHFSTWDSFWGRPGHGAPRSAYKKQRLDRLLYPQMVPIAVH